MKEKTAKILNTIALLIGVGYLVFVIVFALSTSGQLSEAAFNNGYGFRKPITIDAGQVSGSADLTNFPMLVSVTDTDLRTTGNGGDVQNTNGYDIVFGDNLGTIYDFEIEKYVASTGELVAWVKVPTVDYNDNTVLYMYYGNASITAATEDPDNTWGTEYKGVWHMSEDPSGGSPQVLDSTSNNNDGTSFGTMESADLVSGEIGDGIEFNGSGQYLNVADSASLDITGNLTISAVIYPDVSDATYRGIAGKFGNNGFESYYFGHQTGDLVTNLTSDGSTDDTDVSNNDILTTSAWNHVAFTYNSSSNVITYYLNGSADGTGSHTGGIFSSAADLYLGWQTNGANGSFDGVLDEIRISNDIKSADWIATEFNNQDSPGTFYAVGAEEEGGQFVTTNVGNVAPVISGGTSKVCAGNTAGNNDAINGCADISSAITLTAGSTTSISHFVQVADDNGVGDLPATTNGAFYHDTNASPASESCGADNNNCYQQASCSKITPALSLTAAWYRCDYTLEYFSDHSDGAPLWINYLFVRDGGALSTNFTDIAEIQKLTGGTFPTVAFGNVTVGFSTTAGNNQNVTHQNVGNVLLDISVSLDDDDTDAQMDCTTGGIPNTGVKFDRDQSGTPGDLSYASATKTLTVEPTTIELDIDISQRTNDSAVQGPANPRTSYGSGGDDQAFSYWNLSVPTTGVLGACQEEVNVLFIEA